jgi:hypothetical protein
MYKPVLSIDLRLATGFFQRSAECHHLMYVVGDKGYNFFKIVNVNFSTIVAFKGTIRKILNVVAAHTEGLRYMLILHMFFVSMHL